MGGVFRGLELDIANLGDFLRLLGREYRHGQSEQAEKSQNYATNHQPVHATHGNLQYAMRVAPAIMTMPREYDRNGAEHQGPPRPRAGTESPDSGELRHYASSMA